MTEIVSAKPSKNSMDLIIEDCQVSLNSFSVIDKFMITANFSTEELITNENLEGGRYEKKIKIALTPIKVTIHCEIVSKLPMIVSCLSSLSRKSAWGLSQLRGETYILQS